MGRRGGATMAWGTVERLDHLGLIAEVIKDLGLRALMDARLVPDAQEDITPGEAVAGMILHGLGCAHRPLSLPPQFLTQKPLDLLWRQGVRAERCNRFQRGRTLDEVHPYGCDRVLRDMALAVCAHAGLDLRCKHLATPKTTALMYNRPFEHCWC